MILLILILLFLILASYQLGLPGLHYDEAREAGLNAMELLTAASVTLFRESGLMVGTKQLPLMVQDYIGALNVYLSLPILSLTGIGVPNLRASALLLAVAALLALERAVSEWMALQRPLDRPGLSSAGLIGVALLAFSPSFVFWSRQGHFVTNATQPFAFAAIWMTLRWIRTDRSGPLFAAAFCAGAALYAKLLAIWIIGPLALLCSGWWVYRRLQPTSEQMQKEAIPLPTLTPGRFAGLALALALPLTPILLFNLQSGGTLQSFGQNLSVSYYGVDNRDWLNNLFVRLEQIRLTIEGSHFWYLGAVHANRLAPWLWSSAIVPALALSSVRRLLLAPLALLSMALLASIFTVSDLFVTHFALLHPLAIAVAAIALDGLRQRIATTRWRRLATVMAATVLCIWIVLDLNASILYHRALARSGGLSDHSDASYHLTYALRYGGVGAPIALDWGIDAGVRFLSGGTVQPIEIFGYESLDAPDPGFAMRLAPFLKAPDPVFVLRNPEHSVFAGRREVFIEQARLSGREPMLEDVFTQRDGTPLFELWRLR